MNEQFGANELIFLIEKHMELTKVYTIVLLLWIRHVAETNCKSCMNRLSSLGMLYAHVMCLWWKGIIYKQAEPVSFSHAPNAIELLNLHFGRATWVCARVCWIGPLYNGYKWRQYCRWCNYYKFQWLYKSKPIEFWKQNTFWVEWLGVIAA